LSALVRLEVCSPRADLPSFLPLVRLEVCPPGAVLLDFCPWSALKHAHQGQFSGVFAPGASDCSILNFVNYIG